MQIMCQWCGVMQQNCVTIAAVRIAHMPAAAMPTVLCQRGRQTQMVLQLVIPATDSSLQAMMSAQQQQQRQARGPRATVRKAV
jgi:hypothetical protein